METGGMAGCVFNAAKEVALDCFISGNIGFLDMSRLVEVTLEQLSADNRLGKAASSLEDVLEMDQVARRVARSEAQSRARS